MPAHTTLGGLNESKRHAEGRRRGGDSCCTLSVPLRMRAWRCPGEAWSRCTSTRIASSSSVSAAESQPQEQLPIQVGTMESRRIAHVAWCAFFGSPRQTRTRVKQLISCYRWRALLAGDWGTSYFGVFQTSTIGADTCRSAKHPCRSFWRSIERGILHHRRGSQWVRQWACPSTRRSGRVARPRPGPYVGRSESGRPLCGLSYAPTAWRAWNRAWILPERR